MSSSGPFDLAVLPFLQSWTGSQLQMRVLLIPRNGFIEPYVRSDPESPRYFPAAVLAFDVFLQPGTETIPVRGSVGAIKTETFRPLDTAKQIFAELLAQENPTATTGARGPSLPANLNVFKHLPESYCTTVGYSPGSGAKDELFSTGNQYSCALKEMARPITYTPVEKPTSKSWGQMISGLVRNAKFAELAGMIRSVTVDIPSAQMDSVRHGAFVYLLPGAGNVANCEAYSARIPALDTGARELFTPVLFPVATTSLTGSDYDDIFPEAEDYSDGWAKVVHCRQPQRTEVVKEEEEKEEPNAGPQLDETAGSRPVTEIGIQIGWDDQQVTVWVDRQMDSRNDTLKTGLGVRGYRVDARSAGEADDKWRSLVRARGSYGVGRFRRDDFDDESAVEVYPSAPVDPDKQPKFWMPMYFSTWTGPPLVGLDNDRMLLAGRDGAADGDAPRLEGVSVPDLPLLYGKDYEFRVRLADQTGWGPQLASRPINPAVHPVCNIPFRRWVRPLAPILQNESQIPPLGSNDQDDRAPLSLSFKRPELHYPAVQCTGHYPDAAQRLKDIIRVNPKVEPSLPDPDVNRLEITVQIQAPSQDTLVVDGSFRHLYTTTRAFSASDMDVALELTFAWIECRDVDRPDLSLPNDRDPWQGNASTGPLRLPKSRTVRISVRALCREDTALDYFGADDVRRGPVVKLTMRKNAATETSLFAASSPDERFNAYFLQPEDGTAQQPVTVDGASPPPTPVSRLATELKLRNDGNTLRSPPGRRVVFACSAGLRHVMGPDSASLNLMGTVSRLWLIAIKLTLDRDWTWDGFTHNGIVVERAIGEEGDGDGDAVASVEVMRCSPSRNVNRDALTGLEVFRAGTDLVMVDAFDPLQITTTTASGFPAEIRARYKVSWTIVRAGSGGVTPTDPALVFPIRLPVTTPPSQQAKLVSAGIALSPYIALGRYASSAPRRRMLWIELAEPPRDPGDRYFARVLARAPDPLLQSPGPPSNPAPPLAPEPDLPIDPEPLRRVTASGADDNAGLDAMQPLIASTTSAVHWGLPLPPGIGEDSPELLGLWTYEFRVGHGAGRWSTAQGRFGPPLRVAGVQHPAPSLPCAAAYRVDVEMPPAGGQAGGAGGEAVIEATAPLATQASKGQPTSVWFMLYAQAELMDGSRQRRNVLLLRRHADAYVSMEKRAPLAGGFGVAWFPRKDVRGALADLGFASNAPLSVLAVELLQEPGEAEQTDPLGYGLGSVRILRSSPLVEVKSRC